MLSLSVNQISDLEPLKYCTNLSELYLRKNLISSKKQLQALSNLAQLKVLWLSENPIESLLKSEIQQYGEQCFGGAIDGKSYYRRYMLELIPSLEKLDDELVTAGDRVPLPSVELSRTKTNNAALPLSPRSSSPLHSRRVSAQAAKQSWASNDEIKVKTNIRSLAGLCKASNQQIPESEPNAATNRGSSTGSNSAMAIKILLDNLSELELRQVMDDCEQRLKQP